MKLSTSAFKSGLGRVCNNIHKVLCYVVYELRRYREQLQGVMHTLWTVNMIIYFVMNNNISIACTEHGMGESMINIPRDMMFI